MTIRPPLASRLIYGAGGGATGFLFLCLGVYAFVTEPNNPLRFVTLIGAVAFCAFMAYVAYFGGVGTELRADDTTVGVYPPIGAVKESPREHLGSIARVPGLRGVISYQFVSRDGTVLMEADATYRRSDLERFAQFVGVPLRWDADN
jgi:hypothetical protein